MPKSTSSTDRVSESLAAISKATDALFRHTTTAVSVRESSTRATIMGLGTGSDALPAKDDVTALVENLPGVADDD